MRLRIQGPGLWRRVGDRSRYGRLYHPQRDSNPQDCDDQIPAELETRASSQARQSRHQELEEQVSRPKPA